jgi:phage terminase large subunit
VKLKIQSSPIYVKNALSDKKIRINRGGTRSGKSYSISQLAVVWLITGKIGDRFDDRGVFSIVRKYLPALRSTTLRDFTEILETTGMMQYIDYNKTDREFKFNNRIVEFFSVDQETKVRGRKRKHLFIDEANEISKIEWQQLLFRTTGSIFLALNPSEPTHFIKTELEDKRRHQEGDIDVIVSSYRDNPFLEDELVKEIELLRRTDPSLWNIYGLGEWGAIEGLIFNNFHPCEETRGEVVGYGLDFGYSIDPTSLVEVRKVEGELFVKTLIYERGLTNHDISKRMTELGVTKYKPIIGDSAEPKSIEELYRDGWRNIKGATKGRDSISNGIDILKRYKINYEAGDVLGKEISTYKYRTDKNGALLPEPVDFSNHAIDALRYFALNELRVSNKGLYSFR